VYSFGVHLETLQVLTFIFCLTDGNSKMGWQDQIARKIKQGQIVKKTQ
jgi:hypothetical protein